MIFPGDNNSHETYVDEHMKDEIEPAEADHGETVLESNKNIVTPKTRIPRADRSVEVVKNASNMDSKAATDDLMERTENGWWMCKPCGKTMKVSSDLRRHVEIHIEGLSFDCQLCDKTFRSRIALNNHHRAIGHRK